MVVLTLGIQCCRITHKDKVDFAGILIRVLEIVIAALYITSAVVYTLYFARGGNRLERICAVLIRVSPILHIIYMIILGVSLKRMPVANLQEFLSALALGFVLIYFFLEQRFKTRSLGPWILGLAAIAQTVSAITVKHPGINEVPSVLASNWFPFHIVFGILANASIFISAVFSLMYLVLYRSLKRKMFTKFFDNFPPLATLGEMNFQALVTGVAAFTLMIPFGFAMVLSLYGKLVWDFKYCMFFTSYLVYLTGALLGWIAGWRGNRLAIYSLASLVILIVTIFAAMFRSVGHAWL